MSTEKSDGKKLSLKFLISNSQAGSLIGNGGKSIKELIAVTNCRINVSGPQEPYPGTSDRIVLIVGNLNSALLGQQMIWEMIANNVRAAEEENKNSVWSPETVSANLGLNNDVEVTSKITIPAACGGLILGRGGANIKSIAEESGARVLMTGKDEALFTHERVLTISGATGECIKATELVLMKLDEQEDVEPYVNRGTTYASPLTSTFGAYGSGNRDSNRGGDRSDNRGERRYPRNGGADGERNNSRGGPRNGGRGGAVDGPAQGESGPLSISDTTITLSIPNELIGNIFGKQGTTMREIISLSGAKVVVSPRNEFVEGTTNRLLTITGTPTCAQTAHLFITQRLHTPSNPPPRPRINGGGDRDSGRRDNGSRGAARGGDRRHSSRDDEEGN